MAERGMRPDAGVALPLVLAVAVMVTLAAVVVHRAALDLLRGARVALAVARAREAAAAGLVTIEAGGPTAGLLAGGGRWLVQVELAPTGERLLRSIGRASAPFPATAEVMAVLDTADRVLHPWITLRR